MRIDLPKTALGVMCRLAPYRGARRGTLPCYAKIPKVRRLSRTLARSVESINCRLHSISTCGPAESVPPDSRRHTCGTLQKQTAVHKETHKFGV